MKINSVKRFQISGLICVSIFLLSIIIIGKLHANKKPTNLRRAIVTLFTENHICEAIQNCQTYKNLPEIRTGEVSMIAFYGKDVTIESLGNYNKNCPFVNLRPLSLDKYSARVQDFKNNLFKFLTINNVLHEFDTVMYADASVHIHSSMENGGLKELFDSMSTTFKSTGIQLLTMAPHTNYPVTHKSMYSFFNVTVEQMKETIQLQAGAFLINNSPAGLHIMNRMNLCSLHPKCMAPKGAKVHCPSPDYKSNEAIICHRFDQSALNMLMIELYGTDQTKYFKQTDKLMIKRFETCPL